MGSSFSIFTADLSVDGCCEPEGMATSSFIPEDILLIFVFCLSTRNKKGKPEAEP